MGWILVPLAKIRDHKKFIRRFYIHSMLDIIASYQCMQFQGKLMNQTLESDKKKLVLARFAPNLVPENFFSPLLDVIHSYMLSLYATSRKTNKPNLRKWKKT